uniref:Uncharacterized protein n=1 Tax=Panagrolaimus sp. JU765 TaxID=591449 RepID=A0AC34RFV3_9BILA
MNLNSLRQVLTNIYDELPHLPSALKVGENVPSVENVVHKFLQSLSSTDQGQDLLFRYKLGLYQIHDLNQQSIRLANQTSTRMSAVQQDLNEHWEAVSNQTSTRMSVVQQDLNEHWEAVCHMHDRLAEIPTITKQLDDLNRQISSFEKFLVQTEIAVLSLESIDDKIKEQERRRKPPSLMDVS